MKWEETLRAAGEELGRKLERAHPNPRSRRRIRPAAVGVLVALIAITVYFSIPADPAAAIEAAYAPQMVDVRIDDPDLRREFESALAHVERAIALAKDAVRRSPDNPEFVRLCHLAHQAKVRLMRAYSTGG